jgi:hypothetical protein
MWKRRGDIVPSIFSSDTSPLSNAKLWELSGLITHG